MSASSTPKGSYRAMIKNSIIGREPESPRWDCCRLADFAGSRNRGDGVLWYAPTAPMAGPTTSKPLIDEGASARLIGDARRGSTTIRPRRKLSRQVCAAFSRKGRRPPWGSAIDYGCQRCAAFAIELPCIGCVTTASTGCGWIRSAIVVESGELSLLRDLSGAGGQPRRRDQPAHPSSARERRQPRQHSGRQKKGPPRANTARNGTTTITTPGTCC